MNLIRHLEKYSYSKRPEWIFRIPNYEISTLYVLRSVGAMLAIAQRLQPCSLLNDVRIRLPPTALRFLSAKLSYCLFLSFISHSSAKREMDDSLKTDFH
jgi:hypothetical protein